MIFKVNPGCDVPVDYYFTHQTSTSRDDMERMLIGRGSSHKVVCEVVQVDSMLCWEFVSCAYDIGFGLFMLNNDGKRIEVVCNNYYVQLFVPWLLHSGAN